MQFIPGKNVFQTNACGECFANVFEEIPILILILFLILFWTYFRLFVPSFSLRSKAFHFYPGYRRIVLYN